MALYDTIGHGYAGLRRSDPRIASAIEAALGDAVSVVNVGAGSGSYEPAGRAVVGVEPSEVMILQRPASAAPCMQGVAESLPLVSGSVDAAMTVMSAHHWSDLQRGLGEMARVARKRVVVMTWAPPPDSPAFWLTEEYFPEILTHDRTVFPSVARLTAMLDQAAAGRRERTQVTTVPVPHDCVDGFLCAYWRRPECYLDAERRAAISSFARLDASEGLSKLRADLADGSWAKRHDHLLQQDSLDVGYRLVCCELSRAGR